MTPLHFAVTEKNTEICRLLLSYNADASISDADGMKPCESSFLQRFIVEEDNEPIVTIV